MSFDFTGRGLSRLVARLHLDHSEAAALCGVPGGTFLRWLHDREPIPASVIRMLEYRAELEKSTAPIGVIWGTPDE